MHPILYTRIRAEICKFREREREVFVRGGGELSPFPVAAAQNRSWQTRRCCRVSPLILLGRYSSPLKTGSVLKTNESTIVSGNAGRSADGHHIILFTRNAIDDVSMTRPLVNSGHADPFELLSTIRLLVHFC